MKSLSIWFVCYAFLSCSVALAQNKTVPISSMISNFSDSKIVKEPMQFIDGFEVEAVVCNENMLPLLTPEINSENSRIKWSLVFTPSSNDPLKRTLTLVKVEGENGNSYIDALIEKYGRNSEGVPAVWVSGKVDVLICPINMFGEIVSREKAVLTISKGIVVSQENVPIKKGEMENNSQKTRMLDGCWYNSMRYNDFEELEKFVNNGNGAVRSSVDALALSLLIVTDNQGKESGYVLSPKKIENLKVKKLVDELLLRINQLPSWSFGWLETIDGSIFQGRYLKAEYSQNNGWKFADYFH